MHSLCMCTVSKSMNPLTYLDWQSAILLNANIALLAISNFSNAGNFRRNSALMIPSQISIVATLGSILTSLLLIRNSRTVARERVGCMDAVIILQLGGFAVPNLGKSLS